MAQTFRVTVACRGIPHGLGAEAAEDITREFSQHRPWQARARCTYAAGSLQLTAENDFDPSGTALLDEFLDAVVAYVGAHGTAGVVRVEAIPPSA